MAAPDPAEDAREAACWREPLEGSWCGLRLCHRLGTRLPGLGYLLDSQGSCAGLVTDHTSAAWPFALSPWRQAPGPSASSASPAVLCSACPLAVPIARAGPSPQLGL